MIVKQLVLENSLNIPLYTYHDLWMKSTSQLLSDSVFSTDTLTVAFNIMIKDRLLNTLSSRLELKNTLQKVKTPPPNEWPGYDTKQSDDGAPVIMEFCEMLSTLHCHRFQVLSGPKW